ncbi:MAG: hypothetical protein O7F70_00045, partial [Gemmatimonadetes bacterium]|nr:hypothetical protein [Gemmatimonadota bacterium]
HLGGGYFIVLLPQEEIQPFSQRLIKGWTRHKQNLMDSCDLSPQDAASAMAQDWLDLCICITARECDELLSVNQLLDTVSRIRETVPDAELPGIHLDRRLH